jgi:ABC-type uncharacterized transport system
LISGDYYVMPQAFGPAIRKRLWVGVLMVLALVLLLSAMRYLRPEAVANAPKLGLMTTLPLQWSEGGIEVVITSNAAPHPAYARLSAAYQIVPIDNLEDIDTNGLSLLLLAQPRAMGPAELVKLDAWVRNGGRLLVMVDPALQWGSLYPLGDKRRPLFTSLLSPLLSHWGVELVLPINEDQALAIQEIDGLTLRTQTPGEWRSKQGKSDVRCNIAPKAIFADCAVGKGRAFLVADADLLDTPYWKGRGVRALTGSDEFGNMRWVEALLQALKDVEKNPRNFVG